eukprot:6204084-Pleurochrysis_carterae.AAC.1
MAVTLAASRVRVSLIFCSACIRRSRFVTPGCAAWRRSFFFALFATAFSSRRSLETLDRHRLRCLPRESNVLIRSSRAFSGYEGVTSAQARPFERVFNLPPAQLVHQHLNHKRSSLRLPVKLQTH